MSQCLHFTSIQLAELFSDSTSVLELTRHKADRNIRNKNIYKTKTYQECNGQIRELISIRNTSHEHNSKDPSPLVCCVLSNGCQLIHEYSTNSLLCAAMASTRPLLATSLNLKVTNHIRQLRTSYFWYFLFFFFVSPQCARTRLVRCLLLMLHHLCGRVSLS